MKIWGVEIMVKEINGVLVKANPEELSEETRKWLTKNRERLRIEIDKYIWEKNGGSHPLKPYNKK